MTRRAVILLLLLAPTLLLHAVPARGESWMRYAVSANTVTLFDIDGDGDYEVLLLPDAVLDNYALAPVPPQLAHYTHALAVRGCDGDEYLLAWNSTRVALLNRSLSLLATAAAPTAYTSYDETLCGARIGDKYYITTGTGTLITLNASIALNYPLAAYRSGDKIVVVNLGTGAEVNYTSPGTPVAVTVDGSNRVLVLEVLGSNTMVTRVEGGTAYTNTYALTTQRVLAVKQGAFYVETSGGVYKLTFTRAALVSNAEPIASGGGVIYLYDAASDKLVLYSTALDSTLASYTLPRGDPPLAARHGGDVLVVLYAGEVYALSTAPEPLILIGVPNTVRVGERFTVTVRVRYADSFVVIVDGEPYVNATRITLTASRVGKINVTIIARNGIVEERATRYITVLPRKLTINYNVTVSGGTLSVYVEAWSGGEPADTLCWVHSERLAVNATVLPFERANITYEILPETRTTERVAITCGGGIYERRTVNATVSIPRTSAIVKLSSAGDKLLLSAYTPSGHEINTTAQIEILELYKRITAKLPAELQLDPGNYTIRVTLKLPRDSAMNPGPYNLRAQVVLVNASEAPSDGGEYTIILKSNKTIIKRVVENNTVTVEKLDYPLLLATITFSGAAGFTLGAVYSTAVYRRAPGPLRRIIGRRMREHGIAVVDIDEEEQT